MNKGSRVVIRYSSRYEKALPNKLSDSEWKYIEPHVPTPKAHGRPRVHSPREILDAVFYVLKSGCQWRLLPHDFPRWPTVYHYFRTWLIDGTWEKINRAYPATPEGSLEKASSAQCRHCGFPVAKDYRSRRRR
jgi:transposase